MKVNNCLQRRFNIVCTWSCECSELYLDIRADSWQCWTHSGQGHLGLTMEARSLVTSDQLLLTMFAMSESSAVTGEGAIMLLTAASSLTRVSGTGSLVTTGVIVVSVTEENITVTVITASSWWSLHLTTGAEITLVSRSSFHTLTLTTDAITAPDTWPGHWTQTRVAARVLCSSSPETRRTRLSSVDHYLEVSVTLASFTFTVISFKPLRPAVRAWWKIFASFSWKIFDSAT